ncbi:hypothetical protein JMK10_21280 [Rhodovulum sulfidophilum]|uniref:hypothetical protein n=1 Tax=Rhodovulum sulfidophilum TaxID=35806 RepID=UPI001924EF99|nr:hypothetical protein [Rhodovulum sulfidophilum]MCF4119194.1 hypothetical protein [Rhodovulum sulfidophilum]
MRTIYPDIGSRWVYKRLKPFVMDTWTWFRSKSVFVQCLLVVPVTCALAFTLLVGNMGLALMGTAIALNSVVVGGARRTDYDDLWEGRCNHPSGQASDTLNEMRIHALGECRISYSA